MKCRQIVTALVLFASNAVHAQTPVPEAPAGDHVRQVQVHLPRQGLTLTAQKLLDPATGSESASATLPDGRSVDHAAAIRQEQALAALPENKIHPLLRDHLTGAGGAAIPVGIWLRFDPAAVDGRKELDLAMRGGADVREAKADLRRRVREGNLLAVEPALLAVRALGLPVIHADTYAPMVYVRATAAQVAELADLPMVDRLYPSITFQDMTDDAIGTHRWNRVHDFGIRGDGVRVAVLEDNGIDDAACVSTILNVVGWNNANHNIQDHPTGSASVIGSLNATHPGHARGIELLSANGTNAAGNPSYVDTDIIAAAGWAIGQGADVVNCSFGFNNTPQALQMIDRYVDYAVRFTTTTFAVSAGNNGGGSNNVSSPGVAWNCITVGAIDDQNTDQWPDDVMASYSSFQDPTSTHSDREKPEVAAEGTDMTMLDLGCAFTYVASGTSFAAPGVAGMCGALMQMNTTLQTWPEAMKSVMMAAASHNIEGSSRLSDKDGAGGMNGLQAYRIVEASKFTYGSLTPSDFTATGYFTHNIYLQKGDKARVVLVWDSLANSAYSSDVLNADLDIAILEGSGVTSGPVLASSSSWDNSYEIVEFCPPNTGTYTIRVNDYRFDGTSEYYGIAWTQDADGRYVHFRPWLPAVTATDLVGPTNGNTAFWVDPIDFAGGGKSFIALASAGIATGFDFPAACRHSYGDLDILTQISFDPANPFFLGFQGTYSASGTNFGARVNILDDPAVVGLKIWLSNFTIDNTATEGIREIAEIEDFTVWSHATDLSLGDDGFAGPIDIGFAFPFYGSLFSPSTYTQCYINANGNITFAAGDTTYTESLAAFTAGNPRIAPFWDDLNMNLGGKIRYRRGGASQFVVEWVAVPEFATTSTNQNNVLLILNSDGTIEFKYRNCSLQDALVGISPGGGASSTSFDFSHGFRGGPYSNALYELFASGFDLDISSSYRRTVRFDRQLLGGYKVSFEGP